MLTSLRCAARSSVEVLIIISFHQSVLARNGSLWADIFLTKNGANPNPRSRKFQLDDVHHVRKRE